MPPDELYVQHDSLTSVRELRFSTLVANIGEGRLTMVGNLQPDGLSSAAVQVIERVDGSTIEVPIGSFTYHQAHEHWHFVDFMVFELWTHEPDGRLRDLLRTSGKLTFCVVDNVPVPGFSDADPNPLASECGSDVQAISRGWVDIYAADVPGQDLDLADLPDGSYALRTVIDPDGRVRESDESDNVNVAYIEIDDFQAKFVDDVQVASEP